MARSVSEFIPWWFNSSLTDCDEICTGDHGTLNLNADTSITTNISAYHYIDTAVTLYVEIVQRCSGQNNFVLTFLW